MDSKAYVVIAEFSAPAEHHKEFVEMCAFDSLRSVTDEAGCMVFDVSTSPEAPDAVVLYEVYRDKAAFDHHMTTPHYGTFAAAVERLGVTIKQVRFFTREVTQG